MKPGAARRRNVERGVSSLCQQPGHLLALGNVCRHQQKRLAAASMAACANSEVWRHRGGRRGAVCRGECRRSVAKW